MSIWHKYKKNFIVFSVILTFIAGIVGYQYVSAQPGIGTMVEEVDGSPSGYVYKFIVSNGSLSISDSVGTLTTSGAAEVGSSTTGYIAVYNTASSVTGVEMLDEDDMTSNSDTNPATQQSIKVYIDSKVAPFDTEDEREAEIFDADPETVQGARTFSSGVTTNDRLTIADFMKLFDGNTFASAPGDVETRDMGVANNDDWDPCNVPGTKDYLWIKTASGYAPLIDEDGAVLVGSINARTATFSLSGVTGTEQLDDTTTPYVLADDEVAGTFILHDANESGVYTLPDPDPGSADAGDNTLIQVCYSGVTVQVNSGTTYYFNGTATAGATASGVTTSTVGEQIVCTPLYDAAASDWRWNVRTVDD